ncbi:unnamed protein product [Adineta steineri]|uniref:Uncharacterized protein n=1 Tax=Adineta steineri TaxID=433720 RepID=A0A815HD21_9BILA|nr:unnamed protein product [Adineta steineri]CAF1352488.1 unnamed protein product [Adineta steineri]CAF1353454.1 unnamed protein product [Adineta steineri]
MTTSSSIGENDIKFNSSSSSSSVCWQARDAWWKCLDLYDNCESKCQKQIEQLHQACTPKMVQFFEERRKKLTEDKPNRKLMLPQNALHNYLTDFRNNANHNFFSHQTGFPFDDDDD